MKDNRMNELTVNDIIRKVRERKESLEDKPYHTSKNHYAIKELERLLNYIEKDEKY